MQSVGNILLEKEILLESGTNELEILVFTLADYTFGINVAKVREVLPAIEVTNLPRAHRSVQGVFKLREIVVPIVSLRRHLGIPAKGEADDQTFILTDFNGQQTAFSVDCVERIHRLSWEHILAVPSLGALENTPVTAVARIDQRLVIMLDFEMITDQVTEQFFRTGVVDNPLGLPRGELRIVLADDSPTVRQAIETTLRSSGYTNLQFFDNGLAAWKWLEQRIAETNDAKQVADLVISDVEMPQIDGLHLTKRIKQHPQLSRLPVLLYSSIVTPDNHKKGQAVGADAQVSKPELSKVVELADDLIAKAMKRGDMTSSSAAAAASSPSVPTAEATDATSPVEPSPVAPPPSSAAAKPAADSAAARPSAPAASAANGPQPSLPPLLWSTFRGELADRTRNLRRSVDAAASGQGSQDVCNDVFRTLHTIKSASMVVPVEVVSQLTHLMEGLLETTRSNVQLWPLAELERYVDWLEGLANPLCDVEKKLAEGSKLYAQLTG